MNEALTSRKERKMSTNLHIHVYKNNPPLSNRSSHENTEEFLDVEKTLLQKIANIMPE